MVHHKSAEPTNLDAIMANASLAICNALDNPNAPTVPTRNRAVSFTFIQVRFDKKWMVTFLRHSHNIGLYDRMDHKSASLDFT